MGCVCFNVCGVEDEIQCLLQWVRVICAKLGELLAMRMAEACLKTGPLRSLRSATPAPPVASDHL